jgi:hypothetical protein
MSVKPKIDLSLLTGKQVLVLFATHEQKYKFLLKIFSKLLPTHYVHKGYVTDIYGQPYIHHILVLIII